MTKGAPAGSAYLELWCRSFDECYVDMDDEEGMAFTTGFTGQRAVTTWRGRIRSLRAWLYRCKGQGRTYLCADLQPASHLPASPDENLGAN